MEKYKIMTTIITNLYTWCVWHIETVSFSPSRWMSTWNVSERLSKLGKSESACRLLSHWDRSYWVIYMRELSKWRLMPKVKNFFSIFWPLRLENIWSIKGKKNEEKKLRNYLEEKSFFWGRIKRKIEERLLIPDGSEKYIANFAQ